MKVRNGFVSNSSSTSFTFCFKTPHVKEALNILSKYEDKFDLAADLFGYFVKIDGNDVIDCIEENVNSLFSIDDLIFEKRENFDAFKDDYDGIGLQIKREISHQISKLENLKEQGFNYFFSINFGDNEGDIAGGDIGNLMDYEGRHIEIHEEDMIMFTEQDR
jgi:hypothetical protein